MGGEGATPWHLPGAGPQAPHQLNPALARRIIRPGNANNAVHVVVALLVGLVVIRFSMY